MREVHAASEGETETEADSETLVGSRRAPSPAPSFDDLDGTDPHKVDHFVRLDGEVRVPGCSHPSFRHANMGREYFLKLAINHPQYVQISPSAPGLIAECSVWYVVDRFAHMKKHDASLAFDLAVAPPLPIAGTLIPVGPDTVCTPVRVGRHTEEKRPKSKFARMR